jgi:metallo-beta-lactamase family protein
VGEGVRAQFLNAGHVLGSAMIEVEISTEKGKRRILFTGDLGRRESILMKPPEIPDHMDYLLIESTYGNRSHEPIDNVEKKFGEVINRTIAEKGRILIPSFALERTQEIVFILEKLRREKKIPPLHLYVDSPMASNITEIFDGHLDCTCLSDEFKEYVMKKGDPFGFGTVRYLRTVEESKQLNELPGEKVILAGSGMCEGGRILHHLRNNINNESTTVLLVGYQANGTLGRRLADGAKKVKIFGLQHEVRARVDTLYNLSSHADKEDLLWFVKGLSPRPKKIFLVHGDTEQRQMLSDSLKVQGIDRVETPHFTEKFELN